MLISEGLWKCEEYLLEIRKDLPHLVGKNIWIKLQEKQMTSFFYSNSDLIWKRRNGKLSKICIKIITPLSSA